jgi:hypothetical protein
MSIYVCVVLFVVISFTNQCMCSIYHEPEGIRLLAHAMASACMGNVACKAKYAINKPEEINTLTHDVVSILKSHGLTDETCRLLVNNNNATSYSEKMFLRLMLDLKSICANPSDVSDAKSIVYTTTLSVVTLLITIAAFIALAVITSEQRSKTTTSSPVK